MYENERGHYLFTVTKDLKDELLTTLEKYH
jgi:hypothetical protein